MRRSLLGATCALLVACAGPLDGLTVIGEDRSDAPIAGIDPMWRGRFDEGDVAFDMPFRESQGLGPLYIRQSCSSCHEGDGRGPGTVGKMVLLDADGAVATDQSALSFGHTVRAQLAAGATRGIEPPADVDVLVTRRLGPGVFGRGYLEAILDSEIEHVEAEQAAIDDGVSGRIHRVAWQSAVAPVQPFHGFGPGDEGLIGRFGLKARIATVDDFVADAYQGDMGITTPLRPSELPNPDDLGDDARPGVDLDLDVAEAVADYVRLLEIPRRVEPSPEGVALFESTGCATCHVPSMRTRDDYPIAELRGIDAPIYSDLLLHDMGDGLRDGVTDGDAGPREWRTSPLIGLRHLRFYIHDGRAETIEDAVLLHASEGSEANGSVDRFEALSPDDRRTLLELVSTL